MGTEKKQNYGRTLAMFELQCNLPNSKDVVFITLNKFRTQGKYVPVYKTECIRPADKGIYKFNTINLDTDTLFNGETDVECLV